MSFTTRVFPIPYYQSPKLPPLESRAKYTDLTRLFEYQHSSATYSTTLHTSSFKITKGGNNMYNNYDEQFIITQSKIDANKKDTNQKQINTDDKLAHMT